ncbi:uncharacterized protein LOC130694302 [Daphnia carinata]|uniref:uncharacterized protein LOC130694302 n=1 Tax=Daphnia carinata TaxID=120202 RepID=UPI00257D5577|nr:uncharacterized protein LOC130694302 [Daphnia carinata]
MSNLLQLFLAVVTIVVCLGNRVPDSRQNTRKLDVTLVDINSKLTRTSVTNDFESGSPDPWIDTSPTSVYWNVEDFSIPAEVDYPPPTPSIGTKYLRATRDSQLTPGLLVLRTATFAAIPGDSITFKFWIRSKYTGGNTLDLVLAIENVETTLLTLSSYSTSVNFEWRTASSSFPISTPTNLTLIFYGYCGGNSEDAIAIDDILFISSTTE